MIRQLMRFSLDSFLGRFCMACMVMLLAMGSLQAQTGKYTVSGYVKDESNGEVLINATITMQPAGIAVMTNAYGYYSVTLPAGKYTMLVSYSGFKTYQKEIEVNGNSKIDASLSVTAGKDMAEVVITGEKKLRRTNTVGMGIQQLTAAQIKKIPAFMGEPDVVKALLTLPGVTTVGEGASGFNVRGGNVDENLIIMDEAPVYNSSHLLGFFSVFNPDAVKNVTMYKSAFPAEYGGRTSSVLDIRMK